MDQFSRQPWANSAVFYQIYPLGACDAPARNDFISAPVERLRRVLDWLPHIRGLGANALYLGPLFESTAHGYDTADYYHVDRRLGTDQTLRDLSSAIHASGMRLILDGVFNHVGRDFWAFRDVQQHLQASPYANWFHALDFNARSPYGDPFGYTGWAGNYDLVKLNLNNSAVREHLFNAVRTWVDEFAIDGLRLDAADCLDTDFLGALRTFTNALKPDFWLMGEMVGGDYRTLAAPGRLDATTNYEVYKGLYSSLADANYFEIAYSLNRQFGPQGIYRGLPLYAFADNHDVNRVAANLPDPALLYPLYCLLFTMPGVPSIYYGSEFGLSARRTPYDDRPLRPVFDLPALLAASPVPDLLPALQKLLAIRSSSTALRFGDYRQVFVSQQQFAFLRESAEERLLVVLNAAPTPAALRLDLPTPARSAVDLLTPDQTYTVDGSRLELPAVPARWAQVLRLE